MDDGKKLRSPMRAIREKCLDCCGGSSNEVKLCPVSRCPLHAFRTGRNPNRTKRVMTEEQRMAAAERLAKAREARESTRSILDEIG